ncbi:MAG: hypothetical protein KJ065_02065 [Anaerolineae bacterium]|nr:hypothetical protein [Anaerolineae bacterium]
MSVSRPIDRSAAQALYASSAQTAHRIIFDRTIYPYSLFSRQGMTQA